MTLEPVGKILIVVGLIAVAIGALLVLAGKIPFLGKLPGDIAIKREHFNFYFPIATCIVLSLLLSLALWLLNRR